MTNPRIEIVMTCLGCSEQVADAVFEIMRYRPGYSSYLPPKAFESLCWASFRAYRKSVIGSGNEDPIWDLRVTSMVDAQVEEGVAS